MSITMSWLTGPEWLLSVAVLFAATVLRTPGATPNPSDANWPAWRGSHANGSTSTGTYPTNLEGNHVLWKATLPGKGSSTPMIWNGRIILTTPDAGEDAVLAFDFTGKELWRTRLGPETAPKHRTLGSGCNASPVTDGQQVYVYFKSGNFAALDLDGRVRWQTNLVERFGREQLFWDQGSSPVVTDRDVILARLQEESPSWIAGFDKITGQLRWQQPRNYQVPVENDNGYATPVLYPDRGRTALLVWGADHLTSHDVIDGKLLWSCGSFNPEGIENWPYIASPLVVGDLAIVPIGRDDRRQGRLAAVKIGGNGDVSQTNVVWRRADVGVFVCSPAEYNDRIYLLRHRGEVVCIDPASGQTLWSQALPKDKSSYFSSPAIGHGVLYAAREDGMVFAVRVEEKFELLSANAMGERIIASPVPVADRLFLRGDEHLFCIGN
jgi:outer membrane protein assembly factor BamB